MAAARSSHPYKPCPRGHQRRSNTGADALRFKSLRYPRPAVRNTGNPPATLLDQSRKHPLSLERSKPESSHRLRSKQPGSQNGLLPANRIPPKLIITPPATIHKPHNRPTQPIDQPNPSTNQTVDQPILSINPSCRSIHPVDQSILSINPSCRSIQTVDQSKPSINPTRRPTQPVDQNAHLNRSRKRERPRFIWLTATPGSVNHTQRNRPVTPLISLTPNHLTTNRFFTPAILKQRA